MGRDRSLIRYGVIALLLGTAPTIANAYIDPGNGAYMVQAMFTVVATALFYLRHPVRTLKNLWYSVRRSGKPLDETAQAPTGEAGAETDGTKSA
jgi:hypothetical protein